jgi:hypothetical protein
MLGFSTREKGHELRLTNRMEKSVTDVAVASLILRAFDISLLLTGNLGWSK